MPLSREDVPQVIAEAMQKMVASQDSNIVWEIFCAACEGFGFDKMLYGATRMPKDARLGDLRDALILHHGPKVYADAYIEEELYLYSPTYAWAAQNSGFVSWPAAAAQFNGEIKPQHMRIAELNAQFGLRSGFVGSLDDVVRGMHGVIGLSPAGAIEQPEADDLWREVGAHIETLSNLLHLRIASLPLPGQRRPLSTRQLEALHWFAQGKTMQDIAVIMGLSANTVEKHLRMARESLDANTTAHAIQKATSLNLLTV
ncbi:LuxR family transcriptional regulator [Aliishimia ponticola]|uniref:LuxR family transcriptional regulator n=1 Tax=Aliishimia ponticola TaxID=2499833 RepID=A0A4S4NFU4_9RHOB|nr:LuxR family transcriptional regulator [Aliishimia ponticola]THH38482.1 LuxR family transcriptional regulator [Aliishimia ponticola]